LGLALSGSITIAKTTHALMTWGLPQPGVVSFLYKTAFSQSFITGEEFNLLIIIGIYFSGTIFAILKMNTNYNL
tara:strand:- start:135343 stop:135564 length:222 start_codon:yes stop_codon:yes gene_type:complete